MVAVLLPLLAVVAAVFTTRVYGDSMEPAVLDGDSLLVDRVGLGGRTPARGELVLAIEGGVSLVKRVIAVPGDVVAIDGSGARPVVLLAPGGIGPLRPLAEPYVRSWSHREFCCDLRGVDSGFGAQPLPLPAGRYFLLGDNRDASTDSRRFGLFASDQIAGRVVLRWWPLSRAGPLSAPAGTRRP